MRVYVAGPYSQGDKDVNVERAMLIASRLMAAGHEPFVPHLSHFWDRVYPQDYGRWMTWCLAWVGQCQALIRLAGASAGADREAARAREMGLPIFCSVDELVAAKTGLWAIETENNYFCVNSAKDMVVALYESFVVGHYGHRVLEITRQPSPEEFGVHGEIPELLVIRRLKFSSVSELFYWARNNDVETPR